MWVAAWCVEFVNVVNVGFGVHVIKDACPRLLRFNGARWMFFFECAALWIQCAPPRLVFFLLHGASDALAVFAYEVRGSTGRPGVGLVTD